MAVCETCGGEDFECDSGLYYCTLCHTQSQEIRIEETEEAFEYVPQSRELTTTSKSQKKEKRVLHMGRPWQTHEAWTLILKQQVKALIQLGADPSIDVTVMRMWMQYLSKCGVAFCSTEEKDKLSQDQLMLRKERDVYEATLGNPRIHAVRQWKTGLRSGRPIGRSLSQTLKNAQEVSMQAAKEEFYEGDNPDQIESEAADLQMIKEILENSSDEEEGEADRPWTRKEEEEEDEEADDVNNEEEEEENMKLSKKKAHSYRSFYVRQPCYMTLQRTICFLYLGSMHTNSMVMPHDFTNWLESGTLPYHQAASRLPEDMKFCSHDSKTFQVNRPYIPVKLMLETGRLAHFLGIETLPKPQISMLVTRYIMELDLPGELHHVIGQVMARHPPHPRRHSGQHLIPPYSQVAMAYIVLAMKLLFGLDDITERKLSNFAQDLNKMIAEGRQQLFVWSEWMAAKEANHCSMWTTNPKEIQEVVDVTACLQNFAAAKKTENRKTSGCLAFVQRNELTESTHKAIQSSLAIVMERKKEVAQTPPKANTTEFSNSTLGYVTDGVSFLENLNKGGLSDTTIRDCQESLRTAVNKELKEENSYLSSDIEEEEYCASQDLFASAEKRSRKRKKRHFSNPESKRKRTSEVVVRRMLEMSPTLTPIDTEEVASQLIGAFDNYQLYSHVRTLKNVQKHRSYERQLRVCASHIKTECTDLEYYVQGLELVYLAEVHQLDQKTKLIRNRFKGKLG